MKKIEAIIRDTKFQEVKNTLTKLGVKGMTTYPVRGRGDQMGMTQFDEKPNDYENDGLVPKRKIEIFCRPEELDKILETIMTRASTGKVGDGKIFVSEVSEVVQIRTQERVKHNV